MKNHKTLLKILSFIIAISLLGFVPVYAGADLKPLEIDTSLTLEAGEEMMEKAFSESNVASAALDYNYYDPFLYDAQAYEKGLSNEYYTNLENYQDPQEAYDVTVDIAEMNEIYDFDLPENGIPYHPVWGYEPPADYNYAKAAIKHFPRDFDPGQMPFVYNEVSLPDKTVHTFFASEYLDREKFPSAGEYNLLTNSIIFDIPEMADNARSYRDEHHPDLAIKEALDLYLERLSRHEFAHAGNEEIFEGWRAKGYRPIELDDNFFKRVSTAGNNPDSDELYYAGLDEMVAMLEEARDDNAKEILDKLLRARVSGTAHRVGGTLGLDLLLDELNYQDHVVQRELEQARKEAGGILEEQRVNEIITEVNRNYAHDNYYIGSRDFRVNINDYQAFEDSLSNQQVYSAIRNVYGDIMGRPMQFREGIDAPERAKEQILEEMKKPRKLFPWLDE